MRPFSHDQGTHARSSGSPRRRGARVPATRLRGGVVVGLVLVAAALGGLAPRASADGLPDFSSPGEAWNVLPPGESGSTTPGPHSADQLPLYDGLTPLFDQVTDADLPNYFKPNIFGLGSEEPASVERPPARPGLHIDRDSKGVAHVFGDTRGDVMYGAGWVTVSDRAALMELLRGPGRLAAVDAPGIDPFQIALSFRQFTPSAQTEAFLAQQISLLQRQGPAGQQVVQDIDDYLQGINDGRSLAGVPGPAWTRNDVVAVAALIGARFGKGGGDEERLGDGAGRRVFNDLREQNDPEAPVTVPGKFKLASGDGTGNAVIDAASIGTAATCTRGHSTRPTCTAAASTPAGRPSRDRAPMCSSAAGRISPGAPRRRGRTSSTSTPRRSAAALTRSTRSMATAST